MPQKTKQAPVQNAIQIGPKARAGGVAPQHSVVDHPCFFVAAPADDLHLDPVALHIDAPRKHIRPDALRASVLNQLAARSDAAAIAVVPPPTSAAPESPLLAAAKRVASAGKST